MAEKRRLGIFHITAYLIIFFVIWSVRELIIRPVFLDSFEGLTFQILETSMKLLVWTLPAVLLIRHFQDDMWVSLKEMFTTKPRWFKETPILLVVFVPFIQALLAFGQIAIHPDFIPVTLIESVIFAGITEEIVFRGFLLNVFLKKMKAQNAIALDAALFTLIHYPIWIYRGFGFVDFIPASAAVAILSVLFAYSFIKTGNILVPIALHMIWNLLTRLFFG